MHSLGGFAESVGLSEFFIATVIVAIVGNAAEHGGAVVIALRGKMGLASEIAISSSAQVAVFLIPAVALLSFVVKPALPLDVQADRVGGDGRRGRVVAFVVRRRESRRWEGGLLITLYLAFAVWVLSWVGKVGGRPGAEAPRRMTRDERLRPGCNCRYGQGGTCVDALRGSRSRSKTAISRLLWDRPGRGSRR